MTEREKIILEFLEPHGLGGFQNISNLLGEFFPLDNKEVGEIRGKRQNIIDFLDGLTAAGFINMRDRPDRHLGKGNSSEGYKWLDTTPIAAAIGSNGLEQLYNERAKAEQNEEKKMTLMTASSTMRLNGVIERNIPIQNKISIGTLVVAIFGFLVALGTLIKDLAKPDTLQVSPLKETNNILQKTPPVLDSLDKRLRQIDSTLKTLKSDSTK